MNQPNLHLDDNTLLSDPKTLLLHSCQKAGIRLADIALPETMFIAISEFFREFIRQDLVLEIKNPCMGNLYRLKDSPSVGMIKSNVGSAAIGVQVEELIALGVKKLIHLGFAGSIRPEIQPGSLVITSGAVHETAIPQLYGFPGEIVYPSAALTAEVTAQFRQKCTIHEGLHWCTDAPYLETWGKVKRYRSKGAMCVEMEAAGLFAVSNYHEIQSAAVYVISDLLSDTGWSLGWESNALELAVTQVVETVATQW